MPQQLPLRIRRAEQADWPAIWVTLKATFATGDTYAFAPDTPESEIRRTWFEAPCATYVACHDDTIVGTYFIRPNQPGLGSHVSNCAYVVATPFQGKGIAMTMCKHSQDEAIAMGFRAMQFNFVVATNERALRLWKKLGFGVIGRVPEAFNHRQLGYIDVLIMHKMLRPAQAAASK